MKDLGIRFTSGLIGILLLIFVILKGGYFLLFSIYLLSLLGIREFYKAIEKLNIKPLYLIGYLSTTAICMNYLMQGNYLSFIITFSLLSSLILLIFYENISLLDISMTIVGILYIPFMLFHITYLDKTKYIWLIFIIAFGTDTFAYLAGNLFGKHKLCPKVSPKKTVEGALGGVIGSSILVFTYAKILSLEPMGKLIVLSIVTSIISQLGDLTASKIKRSTGVKDFGKIMPGHGGVLDRFDSIIFVSPVIYYYISSFIY